ncbi:MAG TPA: hypothetical protein VFH14_13980, partial [Gemmatimonadaceae bacterium]|nr:hypothetical protein [Gemmatimonadaceae bacterium]
APGSFDVAFADPPYGLNLAARGAERWLEAPFARVLGIEHGVKETMPAGGETRRYGDTGITFYRVEGATPEDVRGQTSGVR